MAKASEARSYVVPASGNRRSPRPPGQNALKRHSSARASARKVTEQSSASKAVQRSQSSERASIQAAKEEATFSKQAWNEVSSRKEKSSRAANQSMRTSTTVDRKSGSCVPLRLPELNVLKEQQRPASADSLVTVTTYDHECVAETCYW